MCTVCRAEAAAEERRRAADRLLDACQLHCGNAYYGLGPSLQQVFKPAPLGTEWDELLGRIDEAGGG